MSRNAMSTQLDRILQLIRLLSAEALSGPQIVARLPTYYEGSGTRMVRSDLAMLKDWGFVITSRRNPARYELRFNPLAVTLTDDHIEALALLRAMVGSSHPLGSSFQHLLQLLTMSLDEWQLATYHQPPFMRVTLKMAVVYPSLDRIIPSVKFAIGNKQQIQFNYRSLDLRDHAVQHTVDPYEIEYHHQHLYLVGYSYRTRHITDFRLDQIDLASMRTLPTPISQPDRDLHPYIFRYRLTAKLARRGVSERFVGQRLVQTFANGDVEIEGRARSQFYALRGLLRYAESATATAPPSLVAEMKATLERMQAQYADEHSNSGD